MKTIFTNRKFLLGAIATLVVVILISGVFITLKAPRPGNQASSESTSASSEMEIKVPSISTKLPEVTISPDESQTDKIPMLNVGGDPKQEAQNQTGVTTSQAGTSSDTTSTVPTTAIQKPPSVSVTTVPDSTVSKDTTPIPENPADQTESSGWTPPPPGAGTGELIWEGAENIIIDISPTVEALQRDVGLLVGNNLLNAGYNSIYPNASPRDLVEDANRNYARTGMITLNPASYGLPKVVGSYNVRLPAAGTNAVEASNYISEYMKSDTVFNDKIKTVFSIPKDGWLSVYQKDGYFYILFVVVDIGYSSYE